MAETNELPINGTGTVYHTSDCGEPQIKAYSDGGATLVSDNCGSCNDIHPSLVTIMFEVLTAGREQNEPLYGFNVHYWTIEELHQAYKTKTGNDFTA